MIAKEWGISFHSLYIFSKSIEQEVYKDLKKVYDKLSVEEGEEIAHFYNNCEDIIPVDECEPNSLIIFDDSINMRQQYIIKEYFVRGRHRKISCVYLSQSYTKVDKQPNRGNINFLCLFKQDHKYLKDLYDEYVGSDFTFDEFKSICRSCWSENYGFLSIDITKNLNKGRYRKMFDLEIHSQDVTYF